jgi:DNA invertase Pin-like site-specific DNA recombinase
MGRTVFYARVSTRDQKLDLQLDAARKLGVNTADIFVEKASGIRHERPALAKALAALTPGDTLACWKLDRIGRSLVHVSGLIEDLEGRGVAFRTVEDGLSTQGSTGKLVLHVLGAVAQFERDLILERARAGLAAARKRGTRLGPPVKWTPDMAPRARDLMGKGGLNADDAARVLRSQPPHHVPGPQGRARARRARAGRRAVTHRSCWPQPAPGKRALGARGRQRRYFNPSTPFTPQLGSAAFRAILPQAQRPRTR